MVARSMLGAKVSGALAALAGLLGSLSLLGVFGPVLRYDPHARGLDRMGTASGMDYLYGVTTGDAPLLFLWSMVLLAVSVLAAFAVWTERQWLVWSLAVASGAVTVVGISSIGLHFLPTALLLAVTGVFLRFGARRRRPEQPDITF